MWICVNKVRTTHSFLSHPRFRFSSRIDPSTLVHWSIIYPIVSFSSGKVQLDENGPVPFWIG